MGPGGAQAGPLLPETRALALALAGVVAACGGTAFPTAVEAKATPRRPDGVVLEPEAAVPPVSSRAPARGVVALREPRDGGAVREVVVAFIQGFVREDLEQLASLLTSDAAQLGARGRSSRATLLEQWRLRLRTLDYGRLSGTDVVRVDGIELFEHDSIGDGAGARPPEMRPGDVLVRVPVVAPRSGAERYFGAVIVFLLRREDGKLKIAGVAEEDGG